MCERKWLCLHRPKTWRKSLLNVKAITVRLRALTQTSKVYKNAHRNTCTPAMAITSGYPVCDALHTVFILPDYVCWCAPWKSLNFTDRKTYCHKGGEPIAELSVVRLVIGVVGVWQEELFIFWDKLRCKSLPCQFSYHHSDIMSLSITVTRVKRLQLVALY